MWCAQGKYDWLRRKFIVKELDIFRQHQMNMNAKQTYYYLNYSGQKKDRHMILYNKQKKITAHKTDERYDQSTNYFRQSEILEKIYGKSIDDGKDN